MRVALWAAAFLVVGVVLVSPASAQSTVTGCSQQCNPQDPDVNDPPVRSEGPANVIFYGHWTGVLDRAPLNTQRPDPATEGDLNEGVQMPTVVVRAPPPCTECSVFFKYNVFSLYTLPGPFNTGMGTRVDGLSADPAYPMELADGPMVAYLYVSAHPVPTMNSAAALGQFTNVGAMPMVRVEATWSSGRHPNAGTVIASGLSDQVNLLNAPGQDPVYEIRVVLGRFVDVIGPGQGTILTFNLTQVATNEVELLQSDWRLRSGAEYPWRLIVPLARPLETRDLETSTLDDTLHVDWWVRSPLGSYDVNDATFRLAAHHRSGRTVEARPPDLVEHSPAFNGHLKSVHVRWAFPRAQLQELNDWTFDLAAENSQGTFRLVESRTASLSLYEGANSTPGFEWGALGAAAGLAVLAWRRRGAA